MEVCACTFLMLCHLYMLSPSTGQRLHLVAEPTELQSFAAQEQHARHSVSSLLSNGQLLSALLDLWTSPRFHEMVQKLQESCSADYNCLAPSFASSHPIAERAASPLLGRARMLDIMRKRSLARSSARSAAIG